MKTGNHSKFKTALTGLAVAAGLIVFSLSGGTSPRAEKLIVRKVDNSSMQLRTRLQVEKLALHKRLAVKIGENKPEEGNTIGLAIVNHLSEIRNSIS